MNEQTTDHDLLIGVAGDVSRLRDDVAALDAAVRAELGAARKRDETRGIRLRKLETTQVRHGTRWKFFGWSLAILSAFGGIVGLIVALT